MTDSQKIFIVVPVLNEEMVIGGVIEEIKNSGYDDIIIVDDGSTDKTTEKASSLGVVVLQHSINRGKGAAVKTGIEAAKIMEADIVITMDGDGQHDPRDVKKMIELIHSGYDVILGSRLKNPKDMPGYKILHNKIANYCTWILYGLRVTDSQSGFRAYSKRALEIIETRTDRYEYDSEVIREIHRHKLRFIEIPIAVRYTAYSMGKQNRQSLKNGIKTLIKMMISN